jgi:hypothetical protein
MTVLSYQRAKDIIVCDPTGQVIEHVCSTDPDVGWVEVWCTYPCADGHRSLWQTQNGTLEERDYMLLSLDNGSDYMRRRDYRHFDLVDKYTGEVLREVRCRP